MLKDRLEYYYLKSDMNCAETILHAAADEWNLPVDQSAFKAIAGFGAGCGCGRFCGAVAGGLATLGQMHIDTRAHATEGFADRCAAFVEAAEAYLGSVQCEELKAKYRTEECRCLKTLELAAEVLEQHAAKSGGSV